MKNTKVVFKISGVLLVTALAACSGKGGAGDEVASGATSGVTSSAAAPAANPVLADHLSIHVGDEALHTMEGVGVINGQELVSTGKDGFLAFGPYAAIKAGTYVAKFQGEVKSLPEGAKVLLDADVNKGAQVLGQREVTSVGPLGEYEFTLPADATDLEVRVSVVGKAEVTLTGYEVAPKQ